MLFLCCYFQEHNLRVNPGLNCIKMGVISVGVKVRFIGRACRYDGGT
jgi:hypothetical protein